MGGVGDASLEKPRSVLKMLFIGIMTGLVKHCQDRVFLAPHQSGHRNDGFLISNGLRRCWKIVEECYECLEWTRCEAGNDQARIPLKKCDKSLQNRLNAHSLCMKVKEARKLIC